MGYGGGGGGAEGKGGGGGGGRELQGKLLCRRKRDLAQTNSARSHPSRLKTTKSDRVRGECLDCYRSRSLIRHTKP